MLPSERIEDIYLEPAETLWDVPRRDRRAYARSRLVGIRLHRQHRQAKRGNARLVRPGGRFVPDRRYRHLAERFALRKGSTVRAPRALFASALARSLFASRELSSLYRTVVASRFPQNATVTPKSGSRPL
jgi:hypothetical protein